MRVFSSYREEGWPVEIQDRALNNGILKGFLSNVFFFEWGSGLENCHVDGYLTRLAIWKGWTFESEFQVS